jgi:hypothetical protein
VIGLIQAGVVFVELEAGLGKSFDLLDASRVLRIEKVYMTSYVCQMH